MSGWGAYAGSAAWEEVAQCGRGMWKVNTPPGARPDGVQKTTSLDSPTRWQGHRHRLQAFDLVVRRWISASTDWANPASKTVDNSRAAR